MNLKVDYLQKKEESIRIKHSHKCRQGCLEMIKTIAVLFTDQKKVEIITEIQIPIQMRYNLLKCKNGKNKTSKLMRESI